jgi:hypothetical protein
MIKSYAAPRLILAAGSGRQDGGFPAKRLSEGPGSRSKLHASMLSIEQWIQDDNALIQDRPRSNSFIFGAL